MSASKAKRAQLLEGAVDLRAAVSDTPAEIQNLGEAGKALAKLYGSGYHFPIVDSQDVRDAIKAIGRAELYERPGVARWIRKRARELGASYLIPEH